MLVLRKKPPLKRGPVGSEAYGDILLFHGPKKENVPGLT